MAIEAYQGVGRNGRAFGYDHSRNFFVEWDMDADGKIVVAKVAADELSDSHGDADNCEADAQEIADAQNAMPNSTLRKQILRARKGEDF